MPRIRSIKPEFWDSPDTAAADLRTRLLYIAMWNWADDYGIGDATPGRLINFAFPNDGIPAADYPRLLADVSRNFAVVFFTFLGRPYYVIPAWETHQRTEKKAKPKAGLHEAALAAIAAGQQGDADSPQEAADSPRHSADLPSLEREREQGNRGTGEQGKRDLAAQAQPPKNRATRITSDWMPDRPVIEAMKAERPDVDFDAEHRRFIDYWLGKSGRDATKVDWNATWRNWIRNARAPSTAPNGRAHKMRTLAELAQETAAEENRIIPKELPA